MSTPAEAPAPRTLRPFEIVIALCTGGLLTFMALFNGMMAAHVTPYFSSLAAHGTGTIAAGLALILFKGLRAQGGAKGKVPFWAYLAGLSGAVTVWLTSTTVNSPLAITGTLALGLAGQMVFSLICDLFGLFGLPRRRPGARDMASLGLIFAGALLIIFAGARA